jgi:N-acetyl-anhydromuramyl-L-alanine amidase AmpD
MMARYQIGCAVLSVVALGCAQEAAGPIRQAVKAAADSYEVPEKIILAVGFIETRWQTPELEDGHDHGAAPAVGITQLRVGDTLNLAARLTGHSVEALADDLSANIEGLAAVLAYFGEQTGAQKRDLASWRPALEMLSGASDPEVAADYASQVFATIELGAHIAAEGGERLVIGAEGTGDEAPMAHVEQALNGYTGAIWKPASSSNYSSGRSGYSVKYVVIHDTEGSYSGTIGWFQNSAAQASAHYVIRSSDGQLTQMVDESNTAWHAGNSYFNKQSVGIEHEGFASAPDTWFTEKMYTSSAKLTYYLTKKYNIPIDRQHIIGHYQVPSSGNVAPCGASNSVSWCTSNGFGGASHHHDPGSGWKWNHYLDLVRNNGQIQQTNYNATLVSKSYPVDMVSGQEAVAYVEFKNTGTKTWDLNLTRLGTIEPRDRSSAFFLNTNWIGANRPTGADHSDYAPGIVGRFTFVLKAPQVSTTTTYVEKFKLVQEGVTWFNDTATVTFTITVRPGSGLTGGGVIDENADPNPGGELNPTVAGGCAVNGEGAGNAGVVFLAFFTLLGLALRRRD